MRAPKQPDEPPTRIPWPPILMAATIAGGWTLDNLVPIRLPLPSITPMIGAFVIGLALAVELWCAATLWRHGTTIMPHRPVFRLVTKGPFRWSRNPIYVSHVALTAGVGLLLSSVWITLLLPGLVAGLTKLAIEPEERHLSRKFGADFDSYVARTRRWL